MGVNRAEVLTMTCDGPECPRTITYAKSVEEQTLNASGNEWMKTVRISQSNDGRTFLYCSDVCEVKGVGTGKHNPPEPKRIIDGAANAAAVAQAAQAAEHAKKATEALKAGAGVKLG